MLAFKACIMVPVRAECNGPNDVCADYLFVQARDVRTNEVVAIKKMSYNGKQSNEVRQDRLCCSLQLKVTLNLKKKHISSFSSEPLQVKTNNDDRCSQFWRLALHQGVELCCFCRLSLACCADKEAVLFFSHQTPDTDFWIFKRGLHIQRSLKQPQHPHISMSPLQRCAVMYERHMFIQSSGRQLLCVGNCWKRQKHDTSAEVTPRCRCCADTVSLHNQITHNLQRESHPGSYLYWEKVLCTLSCSSQCACVCVWTISRFLPHL